MKEFDDLDIFIQRLEEELTPDYDVEKINQHVYKFTVDNLVYQVETTESLFPKTNQKLIEIKFKLLNNPKSPKLSDYKSEVQYQIALKKSQIGITGTGNPIKVFKKVIGAIIKTIEGVSPDYITFSADEKNRQTLYDKLIGIIGKHVKNQYVRLDVNPLTNEKIGPEEFWLKKI